VECLPDRIPARIVADVAGLALGHSIHVRDLPIPEGVTVVDAPDITVASVTGIHAEAETPAAAATESAEPEVIRERKTAEESK
jgi:large subunit ribosomal protein L25